MIGGRLRKIMRDMDAVKRFVFENKISGYALLSWRDGESLYSGTIVYDEGVSIGALVEDIINRRLIKGGEALRVIYDANLRGLIKVGEVYETNIHELIDEDPEVIISEPVILEVLSSDLSPSKIKRFVSTHDEVVIQNKKRTWRMYISSRGIEGAIMYHNGRIFMEGDRAIAELLRELPLILESSTIEIVNSPDSLELLRRGRVNKFRTSFQDVLDLFEIKERLQNARYLR